MSRCLGPERWTGRWRVFVRGVSAEPEAMSAGDGARGKPPMTSGLWVAGSWLCFPASCSCWARGSAWFFTHRTLSPPRTPPPPPPPAETFAVLGVNSGVKQNITASTHSFDGYCNLRIRACFFSGVALRSSVERWILCLSSRFSPRTRMLLAVLMAWKEQNPVLLSTRLERKSKGGCPFNKRPSQVYFVEQGTFPEGGPFVFNHYPS